MSTPFESIQREFGCRQRWVGADRVGEPAGWLRVATGRARWVAPRTGPRARIEARVRPCRVGCSGERGVSERRSVWVTFGWTARGRCSYSARQRGSTRATGAGVLVLEDALTRDEHRVSCRSSRVGGCSAPARAQVTDVPGHVRIDLVPGCLVAPRPRMFLRVRQTAVGSDQSQKFRAMGVSRGPGPRHLPRRSRSDPQ
jgi:hypothetical protein